MRIFSLLLVLASVVGSKDALAQSLPVSIEKTTDHLFHIRHNDPCGADSPKRAYVGFRVENTSGDPIHDVTAEASGLTNGFALAGGQPATLYLGTIEPGDYEMAFWFVEPSCTFEDESPLNVTVSNGDGTASASETLVVDESQATNAGGVTHGGTVGPGAVIGQILTFDAEFEFGGTQEDSKFSLQPAGHAGFDAECFQLVSTRILSSEVDAIPQGVEDELLFYAASSQPGGGGRPVVVRYYFHYRCSATSTLVRPYAGQERGGSLMYSANYEDEIGEPLPEASKPFEGEKSSEEDVVEPSETIRYTVSVENPSSFESSPDSIVDELPAGTEFAGFAPESDITEANTSVPPEVGDTGTLVWRPRSDWVVGPGEALELVYDVEVQSGASGELSNLARVYFGLETIGDHSTTVLAGTFGLEVLSEETEDPLDQLPGDYSSNFEVVNTSSSEVQVNVSAASLSNGSVLEVTSINGDGYSDDGSGTSGSITVGADDSAVLEVAYSVSMGGGDEEESLELEGHLEALSSIEDSDSFPVRRVRPDIDVSRSSTPSSGGEVSSGDVVHLTSTVSNPGQAPAEDVVFLEEVPGEAYYVVGSADADPEAGITASLEYDDGDDSWSYTPESGGCGAPGGLDGCVEGLRWVIDTADPGPLGTFEYSFEVR